MPKVSVCTSVLNQSEYLKRMIESVRAQSFSDWELVIVDDGSTEKIHLIVDAFKDDRIRLHIFPTNRGIPHGLNWALNHAVGEYVQPLSADEIIDKDKFAVQVAYLDEHPDVGCVWGIPGTFAQGAGERTLWEQNLLRAHDRSREAWVRTLMRLENIPIGGASMLMRRTCLQDIGVFDTRFFACSDLEWFVRFFKKYDGRVLPFRFADADQPDTRLTAPKAGAQERFSAEMKLLHEVHSVDTPPSRGKVTIGIPCYNMANFIKSAIASVLAQSVQDFELIVLNDGSTDFLDETMAAYDDPRIKYLKFEDNQGTVAAVNALLAKAEGEFFCSLAADDTIAPDYLAKCLAEFERDPWLEFVASQTDFIDAAGAPFAQDHPFKYIPAPVNRSRENWLEVLYYGNHYFGVGMYRTHVARAVGGWRKEYEVLTDYEMYLRLLTRENIRIVQEPLTHTRIHDSQKSINNDPRKIKALYHAAHRDYYAPRMKVILATPFYEMRGFSPYIVSLTATIRLLTRLNIEHEYWDLSGDSYVDRAKNTITSKFLEDPAATDLFIIDSDMQWDATGLLRMLMLPEQIVMGSYPQKNSWSQWTSVPVLVEEDGKNHPRGRVLEDGSALILSQFLAGGFIRMKRECLEKYRDHFKEHIYVDPAADSSCPDRVYTEFYTCVRENGLRWGEDRVFGKRMNEIGVQGWIYTNLNMGHYGVKGWLGNFDHFLRDNSKGAVRESGSVQYLEGKSDANGQRPDNPGAALG